MKHPIFIAGIVGAALSVTAMSAMAEAGRHGMPSFQTLDVDGSGEITPEEMQQWRTSRFAEMDTDGDGLLSQAELTAYSQKRAEARSAAMIEKMDKDGDGKLSPAEMPQSKRMGRMFDRLDTDKSGGVSEQEMTNARANMDKGDMKKGRMNKPDSASTPDKN